jgi:hypothetical protein
MKIYFTLASFMQPRNMMSLFEINKRCISDKFRGNDNYDILLKVSKFSIFDSERVLPNGQPLQERQLILKVIDKINNHFLGYLQDRPIEIKKLRVLEIYRYLYRFTFLRTQTMVDDPIFIMIIY